MQPLRQCLPFQSHQVISLIGSGGKTSLMWYLAHCYSNEKVLVSTTTKIGYPPKESYNYFYSRDFSLLNNSEKGITLAGSILKESNKLEMPKGSDFLSSFSYFDKVFLEADGSKQLPLKGWASFEPVVLKETTFTIGILPITVIGKILDEKIVHRLPLFLDYTTTKKGEEISPQTLVDIISTSNGLFEKKQGKGILCLNQVSNKIQLEQAKQIFSLLSNKWIDQNLVKVIACNVQSKEGIVLWEK